MVQAANVVATLNLALNCEKNAKRKVLGDKGREQPAESAAFNTADVVKADLVHDYSHLLEMVDSQTFFSNCEGMASGEVLPVYAFTQLPWRQ